ncbi:glycoside hydrolase family 105 protein [Paenibacillus sp. OAS669]|uniref:glycoside hydrolase family 88/105 protein n=1 Tax=Paenibacillus sp. OAS669 TaxID=2663821 RepID=UPI0019E44616|nr:glycoside hydrolase family 88 protein [Paenibacillus sp. OAS669]MBE1444464.1 unsaturated rhamnogalacturonyl hydrolase [Paenibacillus sp. OAS669]
MLWNKQGIADPLEWAGQFMLRYKKPDGGGFLTKRWHYENGCFLRAMEACYDITGDEQYLHYIREMMDLFVQQDGTILNYKVEDYNLDQVNQGKLLFLLLKTTGEEKYRQAIELLMSQLKSHPRTEEGGFWHKKGYTSQMWLDGLYMASPFLARYGLLTGDRAWLDEAAYQLLLVEKKTRDEANGLLRHGWDSSLQQQWAEPGTGRSPHVWSRAMGWYMMALADVLECLPSDHPNRDELKAVMQQLAAALSKVQDPATGLWPQVLDQAGREGNYLESSGSSMFVYALAKGNRLGLLGNEAREQTVRGYQGLLKHLVVTDEEGQYHLTQCNSVAGLGGNPYRDGSYSYYIGEGIVHNDPKAVSPFILAGIEVTQTSS